MRILHPAATLFLLTVAPLHAEGVGTAFTYQGLLEKPAGTLVQDVCAFSFSLCDADSGACNPGTVSSHPAVPVAFGVFTVPDVDFGPGSMNGTGRWMEIAVKCTGDADFATLSPRVELKPAPYSVRAVEGVGPPTGIHVTPDGDVGIGTTTPQTQLDVNGAARVTTVEISGGLRLGFPLAGWGYNSNGQLDLPREETVFTAIAAGGHHSLALRADGTVVGWGNNGQGQTNIPNGSFIGVSAGDAFSVGILTNGTLIAWGANEYGQLGVPSGEFVQVAAGAYHVVAIRTDGTLAAWGNNNYGQTAIPSGTFDAVSAGYEFSLGLRTDGTLVAWGSNSNGQVDVPAGEFLAIAAGGYHAIAIRLDGTLIGWGQNLNGQADVPNGTFTAITGGRYHSLAIRSDGSLAGWGDNQTGQVDVPPGTFTAIASGVTHDLAIRIDPSQQFGLLLATDSAAKPGTNTWTIWSDRRLKKNITPLDGALDRLLQLQGVTFYWRDPASQGGITGLQMGLIADEVQRVFPQWVGRDPKGYQTLTVGGFEALTAEAMRELRAEKDRELSEKECEIESLGSEVQDLKSEISDLKEMVKELVEGIEKSKSPNVQKSKQGNEAVRQEGNKAAGQRDEKGGGQ